MSEMLEKRTSGEKDRTEKYLEAYPDVFADITNVLIVGKSVVQPKDLKDGPTESVYKAEHQDVLREQRRDITKYVERAGVGIMLIGLENQSTVDCDMVFRVMGYDYASYRGQIDAGKHRFPVITGILYYGDRPWRAPCTIGEAVKVPEEYQEMFSDYRIHVIDVPRLPEEVRERLTSDFRVVADYFAGRKNEDYVPIDQPLKHPEAMLEFLRVFTGDERYEQIEEEIAEQSRKGEPVRMCEVLDRAERRGIEQGIDSILQLMNLMEQGGDGDRVLLLQKDPKFLKEMCDKYNIKI